MKEQIADAKEKEKTVKHTLKLIQQAMKENKHGLADLYLKELNGQMKRLMKANKKLAGE